MSLQDSNPPQKSGFSRRRLFGAVGAGAALVGAGAVGGYAAGSSSSDAASDGVDFRGDHQAGIGAALSGLGCNKQRRTYGHRTAANRYQRFDQIE